MGYEGETTFIQNEHTVREIIKREIEGPSSPLGYRGMYDNLEQPTMLLFL